jgi:DNA-binding Lrp family transcriptional regulator
MTNTPPSESAEAALQAVDAIDRALIVATQGGLPLVARPYQAIAAELQLDPEDVMTRLRKLQTVGVIRRVGVVPNHYAIGYRANGMSVWDVPDERVDQLGTAVGEPSNSSATAIAGRGACRSGLTTYSPWCTARRVTKWKTR